VLEQPDGADLRGRVVGGREESSSFAQRRGMPRALTGFVVLVSTSSVLVVSAFAVPPSQ
jgi:hypothetical protein